jgi:hypothetical protein
VLTARHWNSKELFVTTYWTLIRPRFFCTLAVETVFGPHCELLDELRICFVPRM